MHLAPACRRDCSSTLGTGHRRVHVEQCARSGPEAHLGWHFRLWSGSPRCAGLRSSCTVSVYNHPAFSVIVSICSTTTLGICLGTRRRTEEVDEPDVKLAQLWQLLQHLARDDMAPALVAGQLNHLLQPVHAAVTYKGHWIGSGSTSPANICFKNNSATCTTRYCLANTSRELPVPTNTCVFPAWPCL